MSVLGEIIKGIVVVAILAGIIYGAFWAIETAPVAPRQIDVHVHFDQPITVKIVP